MTTPIHPRDIKNDPVISRLLEKMPDKVADSFDEEQLSHIRNAIGAREWGKHKLDKFGPNFLASGPCFAILINQLSSHIHILSIVKSTK